MKKQTFFTATEKDREHLLAFVRAVPLDNRLEWSVGDAGAGRSAQQNRLYWKWIGIIASDTGNDAEDLHEYFKQKFLTPRTVEIGNELHEVYTTKRLKVAEMKEYLDRISAFANGYGIYLPHPEDQHQRSAG